MGLGWRPHRARRDRVDVKGAASSFLKRINFLMTRSHTLPAGPPPEVLDEIDAAWERAQAVVEGAYDLHFDLGRFSSRIRAQLRASDGTPVRILTPSEALALACGDPLPLPV
jgi:hypothetical protein